MKNLQDTLNDKQLEAVTTKEKSTLVLAGAGSGKTTVLVQRIIFILATFNVSPFNILAVTFTNKAAREMKVRVEESLDMPASGMWIGTFHGLCHRILRQHALNANLDENFQILDQDDQSKLLKKIHTAMNLDEKKWPVKKSQGYINGNKDKGFLPADITTQNPSEQVLLSVYQNYQQQCQISGLIDFADLLLRTFLLLKEQNEIRQQYRERFKYILVDEFQDINNIQYMWLKAIAGLYDEGCEINSVMAVGDDDQSIYSWRGAEITHILSFSKEFPEAQTIRLEQNYRSTSNILNAANAVIAKNKDRLGKSLWTDGGDGNPIFVYNSNNDIDEAYFIANKIKDWQLQGGPNNEVAILYRSNAQSRIIEEMMNRYQIPYRIYGGLRFFDRAEIKDALCYMRLVANQNDNAAFDRIINQPARGIGKQTLEQIRNYSNTQTISLWQATTELVSKQVLSARAQSALVKFVELISNIKTDINNKSVGESATIIVKASGLVEFYNQDRKDKSQAKIENLEELLHAAETFKNVDDETAEPSLTQFLAHSSLATNENENQETSNAVDLMTLHSAKGLEYSLVFLTGLEEGLFPHKMAILEPARLEEERRLCYVGITRAKQQLFITYSSSRRMHGTENYQTPSRFLYEIPNELTKVIKGKPLSQPSRNNYSYDSETSSNKRVTRRTTTKVQDKPKAGSFYLGQKVSHAKFGNGVVLNYEGDENNGRVQIKFSSVGVKWLVTNYAKLNKVN